MGVTGVPSDADAEPSHQRSRWPARLPDRDLPAPRLARTITIVVLLCLSIVVSLNSLEYSANMPTLAASVAIVLAVFFLQFLHSSSRAQRWTTRTRVLMLLTQAVFTYAPVLIFHRTWVSMTGPLAGSILLLVPFPRAWIPFAATVAVPASFQLVVSLSWLETSYMVLSTLFTGLVIYGLSRLTDLVQEVHRSRAELARLAVSQERLRFSRDLHDLLGYSLSAITLKSELIYRLVPGDRSRRATRSPPCWTFRVRHWRMCAPWPVGTVTCRSPPRRIPPRRSWPRRTYRRMSRSPADICIRS